MCIEFMQCNGNRCANVDLRDVKDRYEEIMETIQKHIVNWHYEHATRNGESHASETVSGKRMLRRTLKRSLTCGFLKD